MKIRNLLFVSLTLVLMLTLCACGKKEENTAKYTIGGNEYTLAPVRINEGAMGLKAKDGYRLIDVGFETEVGDYDSDAIKKVTEGIDIIIKDKAGNIYKPPMSGSGIFCPGENDQRFCWTFAVPESDNELMLILSDGISIDLAPYLKDLQPENS